MIRKPAADWQRESRAAATLDAAVDAARSGVKVARTGGHLARSLFCWAFAGLWGFAALAAGLAGGGAPTMIGVGIMAAVMAWSGMRAFKKARDVAVPARAGAASPSRTPAVAPSMGSLSVRYDPPRLVALTLVSLALACAAVWWLPKLQGPAALLDGLGAAGLAILAFGCVGKLFGDPIALSYDTRSLTIVTLWRRHTIAWADIRGIGVRTTTTYALGFIRTGRTQMLVIKVKGGMTGTKSLSLAAMLLDLDGVGTLVDLAANLDAVLATMSDPRHDHSSDVRRAAAPQPAAAPDPEAAFDPDAVIARYLAGKAAAEPSQDASFGHRFGNPIMNQPARPFGRRVR